MAHKYKLTHLNWTGLGEPVRYMFAYGNIKYEDVRIEMKDWPEYQKTTPYHQLPFLEVDGKEVVNQSLAICRYLAKKSGILGETDWDAMQADAMVDNIRDWITFFVFAFREQDPERKEKMIEDFKTVRTPFYLSRFEQHVKKHGGYFVANQLTWGELYFSEITEQASKFLTRNILADYPALNALKERVDNIPSIKAYKQNRPMNNDY